METPFKSSNERLQRDHRLVHEARDKGNQQAYSDLMKAYQGPIYVTMLKLTRNVEEAEDLTIEALGKALSSLHLYSKQHAFSTWIYTVAWNNYMDHVRHKQIETVSISDMCTRNDNDELVMPAFPSSADTPEEQFIKTQRQEILRELVSQLKPQYRDLVQMRYFEELSIEEIMERTNLPEGTVKARLFRARSLLTQVLLPHKKNL